MRMCVKGNKADRFSVFSVSCAKWITKTGKQMHLSFPNDCIRAVKLFNEKFVKIHLETFAFER